MLTQSICPESSHKLFESKREADMHVDRQALSIITRGQQLEHAITPSLRCNVAILGFGTVGRAVARILSDRPLGQIRLTHIFSRNILTKRANWVADEVQWTEEFDSILKSDADVVVESVGGLAPAERWIRGALQAGKSVVTANKQVIAHCGTELLQLAHKNNCQLMFGAAVAGGVPVISSIQDGLGGDEIFKIEAILNGTCNFILNRIENCGTPFSLALADAQKEGFAEANPSEDIDGLDARAKLAILAGIGFHANVRPTSIQCRSISGIESIDFEYAKQLGCTIRQVSRAEWKGQALFTDVGPVLVSTSSPFAFSLGSQNVVVCTGRFGGETIFRGQGAGGLPTAVAVVSDILMIAGKKTLYTNLFSAVPETSPLETADFTDRRYLRFVTRDRRALITTLTKIFSRLQINIEAVLQPSADGGSSVCITIEACAPSAVEAAMRLIRRTVELPAYVNFPILT